MNDPPEVQQLKILLDTVIQWLVAWGTVDFHGSAGVAYQRVSTFQLLITAEFGP